MRKKKINIFNFNKNINFQKNNLAKNNNYYIGPWCLDLYDIKKESYVNTLNLYSPENISKYNKDVDYLIKNYNFILDLLYKKLNKIHKKNYKKQFWEILIGRWLYTWMNQVYFRWEYVKKIKKNFEINEFISTKDGLKFIIPENTEHAHRLNRANHKWSEFTFLNIIKFTNQNKIRILDISKKEKKKIRFNEIRYPKFAYYINSNKFFFHNIELNFNAKLKIQKYLGSFTIRYFGQKTIFDNNKIIRNNFAQLLPKSKQKKFVNFIIDNIKFNIPKIFLENFFELEKIYLKSKWPNKAKYIITTYGHYYDELFKFYIANQKKKFKQTRLCILQHGYGNMFSKNDYYNVYLDRKISDFYLSWGNLKIKKNIPFFYPRRSGNIISNFQFKKTNNILLLTYSFSGTLHYPPDGSKNGNIVNQESIKKIFTFSNKLKKDLLKKIFIKNQNINISNSFENTVRKYLKVKYISNNEKFLKIENRFNLFIHVFFGTPFFECMTLNKPSIIIYNEKFHQPFNKRFKIYIKKLKKEKILFTDEKKAAEFINKEYFQLERWWNSKNLQKLRKEFCYDYCYYSSKEIESFKKILK